MGVPVDPATSFSIHELRRAIPAVRIFGLTCFPVYGIEWGDPEVALRLLPPLVSLEALVYRVDRAVEAAQDTGQGADAAESMQPLQRLLEREGLLRPAARAHLADLGRYFALETRLLREPIPSADALAETWRLRSADFRLMHDVLAQLRGTTVDAAVEAALDPVWAFSEVVMDLWDYADDVAQGRFNTYDQYLRRHGPEGGPRLEAELLRLRAEHERLAGALPGPLPERLARGAATWWPLYEGLPDPLPVEAPR